MFRGFLPVATTAFVLFVITMFAVMVGLSTGFGATTASEAHVTLSEPSVDDIDNDPEFAVPWYYKYLPEYLQSDTSSPHARAIAKGLLKMTFAYSEVVANIAAAWAYANKAWVSPTWADHILQAISYLGFAGFFGAVVFDQLQKVMLAID